MAEPAETDIPLVKPLEALRYFRQKGFAFSFAWQDVFQGEHARAFTVAKVMQRDLLEDIRAAVDAAIDGGETLEMFRNKLQPILEAKGWWGRKHMIDPLTGEQRVVQLGSPRRLATIYRTNMRTAQAAGRWERIQRSKKLFPFLEYASVMDGRERPQHHAWDGTILPVDHVWWDTHYPPCGWNCRCVPKPLNQRMLDARRLKVTASPIAFPMKTYTNPRTGEITSVETGIDPGWSYHVGKAALDGVAPAPIGRTGLGMMSATIMSATGDRFEKQAAPFLGAFGLKDRAAMVAGTVFTDRAGWPTAVTSRMLLDRGRFAIPAGRRRYLPAAARAMREPSEIRWRWVKGQNGAPILMRRYIGADAVVDIGRDGWRFYAAGEKGFDRAALRQGDIAWRASAA